MGVSGSNPTARECRKAGVRLSASQVESLIGTVAASLGTVANTDSPIRRGRIVHRRHSLRGPASPDCPQTMLRHAQARLGALHARRLHPRWDLEETHARVLREAIDQRLNIVVAGGTGSGKTTLAGAMINEMVERSDPNERYDHRGHSRNPVPR